MKKKNTAVGVVQQKLLRKKEDEKYYRAPDSVLQYRNVTFLVLRLDLELLIASFHVM